MKLTNKVLIMLAVLTFVLWNPFTRKVLIFILPLGRGVDDILFIIVILALIVLAFIKGWMRLPRFFRELNKEMDNEFRKN